MESAPRKRGRPRVVKMEKRSPEPEDLEAIFQGIDDDAIEDYDAIPNGVDYEVIKNKKNINNNEDVEKEDGPGIIKAQIVPEPDTQEHACNICPRTFKTLTGLKRHKTSHDRKPHAHTNGDFECYDCGNFFKSKVNMERHQLMVHCYDDILNCPTCDFKCKDKEMLSQHLHAHAGTLKPYSCPVCLKSFSKKNSLVRHNMQTGCDGSEKPKFPYQICGKVFNRKDNLREHLRAHAGLTKEKRTYNWEYCTEKFAGNALLRVHRRSHLGYRPYQCDLCVKRFRSSGAMKSHRRIHTGERPHQCQQCNAKFRQKGSLNRHIATHTALKGPRYCLQF